MEISGGAKNEVGLPDADSHATLIEAHWSDGLHHRWTFREGAAVWDLDITPPGFSALRVSDYRRPDMERVLGTALKDTTPLKPRGRIPFDLAGDAFQEALRAHLATAPAVPTEGPQRGYQQPVSEAWRRETLFKFDHCTHTAETLVEIENEHGKWGMAICTRCAHVNVVECPHVKMEWHLDGQVLICANCGIDGT